MVCMKVHANMLKNKNSKFGGTLTFPASLIAEMILYWTSNCVWLTIDITTSTFFIASTKLWWSRTSPCVYIKPTIKQSTLHKKTGEKTWCSNIPEQKQKKKIDKDWACKKLLRTKRRLTPKVLNVWMMDDFDGSERVDSRTRAKVGWPALALASTMNFPTNPVAPIIRILLVPTFSIGNKQCFNTEILWKIRERLWKIREEGIYLATLFAMKTAQMESFIYTLSCSLTCLVSAFKYKLIFICNLIRKFLPPARYHFTTF